MIRILALAPLLLAACARPPEPPRPQPSASVLLITLDTTRADHLGFDGAGDAASPHLDRLAADSFVFTRAIAQAAVTTVSHASIFTGLNPYRHGLRVFGERGGRLADERLTLAEMLNSLGYATAGFVSAFPVSTRYGLAQGFEVFDQDFRDAGGEVVGQRRAGATTDRALAWLEAAPERFFLWLHYFDPHDVAMLPPEDVLEGIDLEAPIREHGREIYAREIGYMDREIGRLLDALRDRGLYDELLIVVVADHGQGLGDHGWWTHAILYQEQIRVPLLIKPATGGDGGHPARRVDFQVRTIDIVPTVLDLLGLAGEDMPFDGRSLAPLFDPEAPDPGLVAYADALGLSTFTYGPEIEEVTDDMLLMVSDGRFKYLHHVLRPAESELYDLENDPRELRNVLSDHPGVARRLRADLMARDPFTKSAEVPAAKLSEEDQRLLRSLGYVQ